MFSALIVRRFNVLWLQGRKAALILLLGIAGVAGGTAPAAAEPPPLEVYGRLPGFETAAISATGKYIALLATVGGRRLLVVTAGGGEPVATYPFGPGDKIRGIRWAGDQAVLVSYSVTSHLPFGFTTDKAELGSVLVLPLDTRKWWQVFGNYHDVTGGVWGQFGLAQREGRWFGYFGGVTLEHRSPGGEGTLPDGRLAPDLYEVDLATQKVRRIAQRADGEHSDRDWLVDGTGAVGATLDWFRESGRWVLTNGRRQQLASGKVEGRIDLVGFTTDGSGVIYSMVEKPGGSAKWFTLPLSGGTPQPYLPEVAIGSAWRDEAQRLVGYISGQAGGGATFFDPHRDATYRKLQKAFRDKHISIEDASTDFDHLLVKVDGLDDPGTWYRVDVAARKAEPIGYSYPLTDAQVGPSKFVGYTAADGTKIEGVLTLPPGRVAKNLPAVVMPHGGPSAHDEPGFDWWAQAYASRGYVVFQPNFRGSTGYGADFEEAGNGEWGRKMQSDISDGLAELVKQGLVDPKRVAIVGASYGGYAALAGVTLQQGLYRCAVSYGGIGDLNRMVDRDNAVYQDPALAKALKAEVGAGRDLKQVSPIRFASQVTVPVMLIHGKDDTVVAYAQSTAMADALRNAGKTVELVTLANEDHWLSKSATRQAMLTAAVNFVLKHNPPDPEPVAPPLAAAKP